MELVAPGVRSLEPYAPGKPLSELEREYGVSETIKLASNENPLGAGSLAQEAIRRSIAEIGLYPDGNGFALKAALARHHRISPECITLGNGSNDLLVLLAESFLTPDSEAVYSQYGFLVYALAVQATGARARVAAARSSGQTMPLGHDLDAFRAQLSDRTRLVFLANPNNPTGTWLEGRALHSFLGQVPESAIAVIDEAYFEYAQDAGCPDASAWLAEFSNLVVLRTFSKAHGLAGLRVGYALSSAEIAEVLNRIRQPFNVNALALAAAAASLDDTEHLTRSVQIARLGREQLAAGLGRLGLRVLPSAGNFVLVDVGRPGSVVYQGLLRQGVIVRPMGGYGLPNHLRVTVGTAAQNERFLAAISLVLGVSR